MVLLPTELKPDDPLIATGEVLILNCTLRGYSGSLNSSSMYFQFLTNEHNVSSDFVHILNVRTAQVRIPDMRREYSSQHIFCYMPDQDYRIGQQVVTVAGE